MKLAIIGSSGFLGAALRQYSLDNNFNTLSFGRTAGIKNKNEEFIAGDILVSFPFEKLLDRELIFYCAGTGIQSGVEVDKKKLYAVNTFFPVELTEYLVENNYQGTLVTFGSYFEIGNNTEHKKFSEQEVILSANEVPNAYCVSKRLFSKYVFDSKPQFKHLHFILPTIYGEQENKNRLIPYLVKSIKNKLPVSLTNGNQVRQYLYVGDLIKIIFTIKEQLDAGIYNMPADFRMTIKELAYKVANFFDFSVDENSFNTTGRNDTAMLYLQLDAGKIESLVKGFQFQSLEKILIKY